MRETDPIYLTSPLTKSGTAQKPHNDKSSLPRSGSNSTLAPKLITFNRHELNDILKVYGRNVAQGDWRDYAIDMGKTKAVFSIFRRSSEFPLYRIEKNPKLARKQGAYSVVTPTGLILKRGQELKQVLKVFDKKPKLLAV